MNPHLDLAQLSLEDALDLALIIEEEASERYGELARQLELHHTPEAAAFFRRMVGYEQAHAATLHDKRRELVGDAPRKVDAVDVPELEAPDYGAVRAFMSHHAALRIALQSETRAHDFYVRALEVTKHERVRELFTEMAAEEAHHKVLVQEQLDKLPPEDMQDPDANVDPPVAH
jgi:rubrerythrin